MELFCSFTAKASLHVCSDPQLHPKADIVADIRANLRTVIDAVIARSSLSEALLSGAKNLLLEQVPNCPPFAPGPRLFPTRNAIRAGIVDQVAFLSIGGWEAFSKTPTASKPVDFSRVQFHLEPKPTRNCRSDSRTAKGLPSPCRSRRE